MIPRAASKAARHLVRAATSGLYMSALAVRGCDSIVTRNALFANARLFAAAEDLDLLMFESCGRRGDDVALDAVTRNRHEQELLELEDELVAAARGLLNTDRLPAAALRRAARLYASAFQAAMPEVGEHRATSLPPRKSAPVSVRVAS